MALQADSGKRLLYAKYLLERAKLAQHERADLGFAVSLLLMHDATEMVMLSVLDELNLMPKGQQTPQFTEFWSAVERYDKEHGLSREAPSRQGMSAMNRARVALKHHGILPNPETARDFLPRVEVFCEEISRTYMNVEFAALSLADLISNVEVRNLLKQAEQEFASGDKGSALSNLKLSFIKLERSLGLGQIRINSDDEEVVKAVKALGHTVDMLSIGIDPIRYRFFHANTPVVHVMMAGNHQTVFTRTYDNFSEQTFETLVQFVVESALRTAELIK
jgi:hypothetical protein